MTKANRVELGEIIAQRELNYSTISGEQTLTVKIGKPRPDLNQGGDWECPIQVGDKVKFSYGIDSCQALSLGLQLISIELRFLKETQKLNLNWLKMDDLGFEPIRE